MKTLRERPTWVYRLEDTEGALLYVGIAASIEARLAQHRATKRWWHEVVFISAEQYANRRQALAVEQFYIKTERPCFNVVGQLPEPERPFEPVARRHYLWRQDLRRLIFEARSGQEVS